jgi:hypothetical protein
MNREFVVKCISGLIGTDYLMDNLLDSFKMHYNKPVSSMADIKLRENRKVKGDVMETFCQLYFEFLLYKDEPFYSNTWLLDEVPEHVRKELGLAKRDLGIDLILEDINGEYYAVQVKYRQHPRSKTKNVIGWKQLSTFYALCNRTGPYKKHIVFTNADFIRHVGKKDPKDKTYAIGTLRNIKKDHWFRMAGINGVPLDETTPKSLTREQVREARIKVMTNVTNNDQLPFLPI